MPDLQHVTISLDSQQAETLVNIIVQHVRSQDYTIGYLRNELAAREPGGIKSTFEEALQGDE
mgnify:CR=1 FL=1